MQIGATFPQTEFGDDPAAIRDYAQTAEGAGLSHLIVYDHVVGADPAQHPGFSGPYTHQSAFHEPFVLYGYLAGVTERLELATGIVIAPQRQTVLLAKQAAALDVLSRGRLRLGLAIGWNAVEYEALNENFHNRGRRLEEQITLLRRLWTEPVVTFEGRWHHVHAAGINPLPVRQPIPLWLGGGGTEPVLQRIARRADGWFMGVAGREEAKAAIERLHGYMREAGRDPGAMGIEAGIRFGHGTSEEWEERLQTLRALGVTHTSINTMGAGFTSPQQHIAAIRRFAEVVVPLAGG